MSWVKFHVSRVTYHVSCVTFKKLTIGQIQNKTKNILNLFLLLQSKTEMKEEDTIT